MLVTPQNCTKMLRNLTFVSCTICSLQILASDQNKFLLFWATFEQLSLLTKSHFWLFFEQRFEKLRETFWKISSNLWKALAEVPKYPLFLAETYLRNAAFRYPETVFDWLHHQLHHSHLLFSIVSHPSLPRSCPFHSFFFLSFSFFLFFRWAVFISLVSTLPRQTLSLMRCRSPPPAYTWNWPHRQIGIHLNWIKRLHTH